MPLPIFSPVVAIGAEVLSTPPGPFSVTSSPLTAVRSRSEVISPEKPVSVSAEGMAGAGSTGVTAVVSKSPLPISGTKTPSTSCRREEVPSFIYDS